MTTPTCHPRRPHYAKGLCRSCYNATWQHQNKPAKYVRGVSRLNLVGERYGKLTVLRADDSKQTTARRYTRWWCRCDCGKEKSLTTATLRNGGTRSCGCAKKWSEDRLKGHGGIPGSFWSQVRRSAFYRHLELAVTIQEAWVIFEEQDGRCVHSGVPLSFTDKSASLDRKDSSLPYTRDNVQWVHQRINLMKGSMSDASFIDWCHKVADYDRR